MGSRIDPTGVEDVGYVYHAADNPYDWTRNEAEAFRAGKDPEKFSRKNVFAQDKNGVWTLGDRTKGDDERGKISSLNHSNVTPGRDETAGGVTFDFALQTTVLSLPALRRLRFPVQVDGNPIPAEQRLAAENAARTALAALALAAISMQRERGYDLRSRSLLVPETASPLAFEFIPSVGGAAETYSLDTASALALFKAAHEQAQSHGFGWQRQPLMLKPMPKLVSLIRESRKLAARGEAEEAGGA